MNEIVLVGGRFDGRRITWAEDQAVVRIPFLDESDPTRQMRVLSPSEWEDPKYWEIVDGRLERKHPHVATVEYRRTDERDADGRAIFRWEP